MSQASRRDLTFVHLAVLLFGLAGLFARVVAGGAWVIVSGRTLFAALALLLFGAALRKPLSVAPPDWPRFALTGFLLAAHWWTFFHAIEISSVAIGLLGFASFPAFVLLLEPLATGEHSTRADRSLALVVTLGLLLVVPEYSWAAQQTQGLLWAVASGLLFALLTLANRRLAPYGATRVALWQNAVAALLLAPVGWPLLAQLGARDWWFLLLLGVVFTALAHGLFIASLRTVPARQASVLAALEPVYGIAFAWLLFAEIPAARSLLGGALILAATVWGTVRCGSPKQKAPSPV